MLKLEKYSMGVGDRFGLQGRAQLDAMIRAAELGIAVTPVWNKSHREHTIVGTVPAAVRREADEAVRAGGWRGSYHVDADHINLKNVGAFIEPCDFFTLDVADTIGQPADAKAVDKFVAKYQNYTGMLAVEGLTEKLTVTTGQVREIAARYLLAAQEAGRIYRHIAALKGADRFVTEVSMDETSQPQTPVELLFILAALADEGIPLQTIAPKFTGRFNKGVDYVGDVRQFEREFNDDLAVIRYAIGAFGLPRTLKLSVHSGSDKFSIYGPIRRALRRFDAGLHLKTAGTTWLEELIGLAMAGGDGLAIAKEVYREALAHYEELCAPYATVIDIDPARLPAVAQVESWDGPAYAAALRHDPGCSRYNLHFRQLLHVGYKVAARMGDRYLDALRRHETLVAEQVAGNLLQRHIIPVFGTAE